MATERAAAVQYVSIHAAQTGCDQQLGQNGCVFLAVSIHAAQAGCDMYHHNLVRFKNGVSIHAAQAGCDPQEMRQ